MVKKIKIMIEEIKEWFADLKAKRIERREKAITAETTDRYNVTERNGDLYLMVDGYAIKQIDNRKTVAEVVSMINEARTANISYNKTLTV